MTITPAATAPLPAATANPDADLEPGHYKDVQRWMNTPIAGLRVTDHDGNSHTVEAHSDGLITGQGRDFSKAAGWAHHLANTWADHAENPRSTAVLQAADGSYFVTGLVDRTEQNGPDGDPAGVLIDGAADGSRYQSIEVTRSDDALRAVLGVDGWARLVDEPQAFVQQLPDE